MDDGDRFLDIDGDNGEYHSLLEIVDSYNHPLSERIPKSGLPGVRNHYVNQLFVLLQNEKE
jgi:hypothetical protein